MNILLDLVPIEPGVPSVSADSVITGIIVAAAAALLVLAFILGKIKKD